MKRICAAILVLSLSLSIGSTGYIRINASNQVEKPADIKVLEVQSEEELNQNYDMLNNVEVVCMEQDAFEQIEIESLKEVLDNGTDLFVRSPKLEVIEEILEKETTQVEEGKEPQVCYISADETGYNIMPVHVDVAYDEEVLVDEKEYQKDKAELNQFVNHSYDAQGITSLAEGENVYLNPVEIYETKQSMNEEQVLSQMTQEELVSLQTSTLIGKSFVESSKLVYLYKEGTPNSANSNLSFSSNSTKAGWSKIGSLNLNLYGIKVKTIGDNTFDNVYSVVVAGGINDKYVKQFTVGVGVPALSSNVILDETVSAGSGNGKLATSVSSSGAVSSYTTYAFNTSNLNVSTSFGNKYEKKWTFSPKSFSENTNYRVRPGILLKKVNGRNASVTGTVMVNSFTVSGGIKNYTIKDTVKCSIAFKNHIAV